MASAAVIVLPAENSSAASFAITSALGRQSGRIVCSWQFTVCRKNAKRRTYKGYELIKERIAFGSSLKKNIQKDYLKKMVN